MIDPIAFEIFGIKIYWYGLVYGFGFLLTYFLFMKKDLGFKKELKEDIFFYLIIYSILFGRLFYVIFYEPLYYLKDPIKILYIWEGGMSIHGGLFGGFLTLFYLSRKYKFKLLKVTDFLVIPLSLFLCLGRIANFINQELYGYVIKNEKFKFLGVVFNRVDNNLRYPTQLFSALKNFLLFYFLSFYKEFKTNNSNENSKNNLLDGELTFLFLIFYNFGRFFIDFLRVPTGIGNSMYNYTGLSLGQIFCLIYGFIGIYFFIKLKYVKKKK